ncbi:hypothetical protein LINGRAHAP2_LOCUS2489, partial [Linum grandiflorum]
MNLQEADETIQPIICQVLEIDLFAEIFMKEETVTSNLSLLGDSEHSPSYPHRHRPQKSNHKHGGRSARWSRRLDPSSLMHLIIGALFHTLDDILSVNSGPFGCKLYGFHVFCSRWVLW